MAVDVSRIPNNNKFDPVREAILQLQEDIQAEGQIAYDGEITVGKVTGSTITVTGGSFTVNQATPTTISIGIDDSGYYSTSGGEIDGDVTITGNLVVEGNLTVSGATITKLSEEVLIEDNIIVLNSNEAGTPSLNSGIEIERGTSPNVDFLWNETSNEWDLQTYSGARIYRYGVGSTVLTIEAGSTAGDAVLALTPNTGTGGVIRTTNEKDLVFQPYSTTKMVIASGGDVNIYDKLAVGKTSAPAYDLDVDGTGYFSGALTLGSLTNNTTATFALVNAGSGVVAHRQLGSNAFNSTAYLPLTGGTLSNTLTITKNGIGLEVENTANSGADTGIRIRGARNGQTYSGNDNQTAYILFSNYDDNTTPNSYDLAKIGAGMYDADDDTGFFQIQVNDGTALVKALDIEKNKDATFYGDVTAPTFIGDLTGDVTGNLIGNVTGSASLNVLKTGDSMSGNLYFSDDTEGIHFGSSSTRNGAIYFDATLDGVIMQQTQGTDWTRLKVGDISTGNYKFEILGGDSTNSGEFNATGWDSLFTINGDGDTDLVAGNLQVGSTVVITTGRNLTNIGTGSFSGDITFANGQGIVSSSGAEIKTGAGGGTFNVQAGTSTSGAFNVKNSAGTTQLSVDNGGDGWSYFAGKLAVNQTSEPTDTFKVEGSAFINGTLRVENTLDLRNSDAISFETGKHWITFNDAEGNFNIRVGHYSNATPDEECTEAGYIFHDEWSQSGGWREFNVSRDSMTVGQLIGTDSVWYTQIKYDYNKVYLFYQGTTRLQTTSDGIDVTGNINLHSSKLYWNTDWDYLMFDDDSTDFTIHSNATLLTSRADVIFQGNANDGTSSGNFIFWQGSATSGAEVFVVKEDSNVNIVSGALQIGGTTTIDSSRNVFANDVTGNDINGTAGNFEDVFLTNASGASLAFRNSQGNTVDTDNLATMSFQGYYGTAFVGASRIQVKANENFSSTARGTVINFDFWDTGSVYDTVASIDSSGLYIGTTNVYDNLPDGITYSTTDNRLKIGVSKNVGSTTETAIQPILLADILNDGFIPYIATGGAGSATVNSRVSDSWLKINSDTLELGASDPVSHEIRYARFLWQSGSNDKVSTVYGAKDITASIQYLGGSTTAKIEFTGGSGGGRIQFNDEYTFPATDGTSGQVLTTDGSGDLSWGDASSTVDLQDVTTNGSSTTDTITAGGFSTSGQVAGKYLTLTNQELTLNPPAYSIWLDANDGSYPANLGDYSGSYPLGIYVNGDDGIATTTLGSGTVQVYHTGHFSGTNISNWQTAYTYSQVGHLELGGGTLTGTLNAPSPNFTGTTDVNILRLDRGNEVMLQMKDSGGDYTGYLTMNDGNGNMQLMLGVDGAGQYIVTNDGASKLVYSAHGTHGAVSLNAAQQGTAGNTVTFSIGLLVDSTDNTIKVGNPNNATGFLVADSNSKKVFNASGDLFTTEINARTGTEVLFNDTLRIDASGVPQLILDGGSDTTGDIVVPDGEILQVGHWNSGTSTYTDRFRIDGSGNGLFTGSVSVGQTSSPSYTLDVSGNTRLNGLVGINTQPISSNLLNMQFDNTNADDDFHFAQRIDGNFSGADNTTADREQGGIYLDIDSSADGDAANEHRLYGIYSDVRYTGYSDIVYSGFFRAESNNSTETTSTIYGLSGQAVHDSNATGGVDQMIANHGLASVGDAGDVSNAYGGYFMANTPADRTANVGNLRGIRAEVQIDAPVALTYGEVRTVESVIDNNEGTLPSGTNSYLFYGEYQGTRYATNAYGLWVQGDKHYLEGLLGIGTGSPNEALDVIGSVKVGNLKIQNANGGRIGFNRNTATGAIYDSSDGAYQLQHNFAGYLELQSYNSSGVIQSQLVYSEEGQLGLGTTAPNHKVDIYSNENVPLRIHRPNNANLDSSGAWGIGFSTRGDGNTSTTDTRAGIFSYYNGNLFLATGTSSIVSDPDAYARLTVTGAGAIGIGTTSPAEKLDVAGTIRSNAYEGKVKINSTATNGKQYEFISIDTGNLGLYDGSAYRLWVAGNGNIGVGTVSPSSLIHLVGNSAAIRIEESGGAQVRMAAGGSTGYLGTYSNHELQFLINGNNAITVNTSRNVGIGTTSPSGTLDVNVTGNNRVLRLSRDTGTNGRLDIDFESALTNLESLGSFVFKLGASPNEVMRLTGTGLGIGTTSPTKTLDVDGAIRTRNSFNISDGTTQIGGLFPYKVITGSGTDNSTALFAETGLDLHFMTNGSVSSKMIIQSNGNVGIGTTSPSAKLEVNGTFKSAGIQDAANANAIFINGNEEVGIGTTSPTQKLDVAGNIAISSGGDLLFANGSISSDDNNTGARIVARAIVNPSDGGAIFAVESSGSATRFGVTQGYGGWFRDKLQVGYAYDSAGLSNPTYHLDVAGTIRATGDVIAYSDARVKENVKTIDNALDKVTHLRGVSYNKIGETEEKIGVIAQEIEKVLPQVVQEDNEGMKSVAYGNIVGVLIEAIKELKDEVNELKSQINGSTK